MKIQNNLIDLANNVPTLMINVDFVYSNNGSKLNF